VCHPVVIHATRPFLDKLTLKFEEVFTRLELSYLSFLPVLTLATGVDLELYMLGRDSHNRIDDIYRYLDCSEGFARLVNVDFSKHAVVKVDGGNLIHKHSSINIHFANHYLVGQCDVDSLNFIPTFLKSSLYDDAGRKQTLSSHDI
jgi:hypothetical protein